MNKGEERGEGLRGWRSVEEIRGQKGFGFALMGRRGAIGNESVRGTGRGRGAQRYSLRLRGRQREERENSRLLTGLRI